MLVVLVGEFKLDVAVGGCRESEADVVDLLVVGVVRICVGDVGSIVRWLAKDSELE